MSSIISAYRKEIPQYVELGYVCNLREELKRIKPLDHWERNKSFPKQLGLVQRISMLFQISLLHLSASAIKITTNLCLNPLASLIRPRSRKKADAITKISRVAIEILTLQREKALLLHGIMNSRTGLTGECYQDPAKKASVRKKFLDDEYMEEIANYYAENGRNLEMAITYYRMIEEKVQKSRIWKQLGEAYLKRADISSNIHFGAQYFGTVKDCYDCALEYFGKAANHGARGDLDSQRKVVAMHKQLAELAKEERRQKEQEGHEQQAFIHAEKVVHHPMNLNPRPNDLIDIAEYLETGTGTKPDLTKALTYYMQAAKQHGCMKASSKVAFIQQQISGTFDPCHAERYYDTLLTEKAERGDLQSLIDLMVRKRDQGDVEEARRLGNQALLLLAERNDYTTMHRLIANDLIRPEQCLLTKLDRMTDKRSRLPIFFDAASLKKLELAKAFLKMGLETSNNRLKSTVFDFIPNLKKYGDQLREERQEIVEENQKALERDECMPHPLLPSYGVVKLAFLDLAHVKNTKSAIEIDGAPKIDIVKPLFAWIERVRHRFEQIIDDEGTGRSREEFLQRLKSKTRDINHADQTAICDGIGHEISQKTGCQLQNVLRHVVRTLQEKERSVNASDDPKEKEVFELNLKTILKELGLSFFHCSSRMIAVATDLFESDVLMHAPRSVPDNADKILQMFQVKRSKLFEEIVKTRILNDPHQANSLNYFRQRLSKRLALGVVIPDPDVQEGGIYSKYVFGGRFNNNHYPESRDQMERIIFGLMEKALTVELHLTWFDESLENGTIKYEEIFDWLTYWCPDIDKSQLLTIKKDWRNIALAFILECLGVIKYHSYSINRDSFYSSWVKKWRGV